MDRLYVARLRIDIDRNWGMGLDFNYSERKGLYEYDETCNGFKGIEEGNLVTVPSEISVKTYDGGFEFCQGFSNPLGNDELDIVKEGMEKKFLGLMRVYKDKYC